MILMFTCSHTVNALVECISHQMEPGNCIVRVCPSNESPLLAAERNEEIILGEGELILKTWRSASLSLMAEWIWELSHSHAEAKASVCVCPCISLATCERVWQGHADFQPSVSEQFGEPSSSALLHLGDRVSRRISFRLKKIHLTTLEDYIIYIIVLNMALSQKTPR